MIKFLSEARDDLLCQLNVATATWSLGMWETAYGISTDVTKADEYRRTRLLSKMRGLGTTTKKLIENVAESFSNGDVDIIEDPSTYSFAVKFVGTVGIPPNMDDLTAAIEEIKPAHLTYTYIYIYNTNAVLSSFTNAHLHSYTNNQMKATVIH